MKLSGSLKTSVVGASFLTALLVLTALRPSDAFATVCPQPSFTLTPLSATNPIGISHTITAQLSGSCTNSGPSSCTTDNDCSGTCDVTNTCTNNGAACSTDADCASSCDFSCVQGDVIWIGVVSGPNSGASAPTTSTNVDANGQATFTYSSSVEGTDTIQGCLDLDGSGSNDETTGSTAGDLAMCISDGIGENDLPSGQVTKTWIAAISGSITLSPTAAVNPDNPAPKNHTVTATVSGIQTCSISHAVCVDNSNCSGGAGDTCSDPSNVTVGFVILSGPNKGDKGWTTTDATGTATLTYLSNGVAGLDTIQACIDGDPSSPGSPDENPACFGGTNDGSFCSVDADCTGGGKCVAAPVISCLTDATSPSPTEPDFASNQVTKRWDPTLSLKNLDAAATIANLGVPVYTTGAAFNPIGSTHTVQATITGAAKICFNTLTNSGSRTACTLPADCTVAGETCGIAGYPVFFGALPSSQNAGNLGSYVNTDASGIASKTYSDTNGAGIDTIQACVDADVSEGIPDDTTFKQCLNDYAGGATTGQADIPSNTVVKNWLGSFVTGGGKVITGSKTWDSFGGTVGYKPGTSTLLGEWNQQVHQSKGGNMNCHWNSFTSFAFACSSGNCGTKPDTVLFTTANIAGACGGLAGSQGESVKIYAPGTKPAQISVFNATNGVLNVATPVALVNGSGNFVIHK
jgi:hypothetical protein